MKSLACPICNNTPGGLCLSFGEEGGDWRGFDCESCGRFKIVGSALNEHGRLQAKLTSLETAALAHRIRLAVDEQREPMINTRWIADFRSSASLPSPAIQVANVIRLIGNYVMRRGESYQPDPSTIASVGSANSKMLYRLLNEMVERGILREAGDRTRQTRSGGNETARTFDLSLDGWEQFEKETRGQVAGRYGFMALKFGDDVLDPLLDNVIRPGIREATGFDLVDMRSVSQAGLIDNIMRAQIRDSAFVLVDLTHDNSGAYWEAGYAEGLGKPVIYICERSKFERAQTHFDTNHCTTVMWSAGSPDVFIADLIATIRRSLNLFLSVSEERTF